MVHSRKQTDNKWAGTYCDKSVLVDGAHSYVMIHN